MTATTDVTIAARVSPALRADLERLGRLAGDPDLSSTIRRACSRLVAEHDHPLGSLDAVPASHNGDPATAHRAALEAWPRAKTQRRRVLEAFAERVTPGLTADEVARRVGWPDVYTARRRISELKLGGWLEPLERDGEVVTRPSSHGNPQEVLTLTAKGAARLPELRFPGQTTLAA